MRRTRLITLVAALFMALGLIGVSPSVPLVGSDNVATAASCLSLNTLDRLYGIQINVQRGSAKNGVLYNGKRQRAGVVVSLTKDQREDLSDAGWLVQGEGRVRSIWTPNRCAPLATGGWTPSVTKARTCLTIQKVDNQFGIEEDALNTDFGLIRKKSGNKPIIGAVVHVTQAQKAILDKKDWGIQGANSTVKSIFAPSWCLPLKMGGWTPTSKCYTFSALVNQYGGVPEAPNGGRLYDDGLAGALLHLDSSERSKLTSQNWDIQDGDKSDDVASAWAPQSCRPLRES